MADTNITIRTNQELSAKVSALAAAMDRSRNWVIEDALREYVAHQAWQVEGIQAAMHSLDQGTGISHTQAMEELEALLANAPQP